MLSFLVVLAVLFLMNVGVAILVFGLLFWSLHAGLMFCVAGVVFGVLVGSLLLSHCFGFRSHVVRHVW